MAGSPRNMRLLDNKIAVVTGVSAGIGWAIVKTFIEQGAQVIGVARSNPSALPESLEPAAFEFVPGDVTAEATRDRVAEVAEQVHGRIDILVNNAAMLYPGGAIHDVTDGDWQRIFQVNLLSVAKLTARLLPLMRNSQAGRIINVGSVLSLYGAPLGGPYVVSKHALLGLTRTQALEYAPIGITANCLLPGAIDTEMFRSGDPTGEFRRRFGSKCP